MLMSRGRNASVIWGYPGASTLRHVMFRLTNSLYIDSMNCTANCERSERSNSVSYRVTYIYFFSEFGFWILRIRWSTEEQNVRNVWKCNVTKEQVLRLLLCPVPHSLNYPFLHKVAFLMLFIFSKCCLSVVAERRG
jgi:hypothetical protein